MAALVTPSSYWQILFLSSSMQLYSIAISVNKCKFVNCIVMNEDN